MGFYSQVIVPWFLDWAMDRRVLNQHRRELLSEAKGEVLEIGFGTGLNLSYYPPEVQKITAVDPNPGMYTRARKRIQASRVRVESNLLSAESLPMADSSFDTVVSTMTLCSILHLNQTLREVYRVLKPGGQFLFLEHGRSADPKVQVWQDRLTPISKALGDGCRLNRDIRQFIGEQPFVTVALRNYYLEDTPKFAGYMYQGAAQKS